MSASMCPPAEQVVVDLGNAPEIFIDGVAVHDVIHGVIRLALYAEQPVTEAGEPCRRIRVIVLKLLYSLETQAKMRRQLVEFLGASGIGVLLS